MKHKKTIFILCGLLFAVFTGLISAYCIHAQTLLNAYSEETIIRSLSEDKDNPIVLIGTEKYEDYLAVFYKSPFDDDSYDDYAHFETYKKSKLYKNRYKRGGYGYGNITGPSVSQVGTQESTQAKCFFYDVAREETTCVVYETDLAGNYVRKLDEFEIPKTPYIIVKEYELLDIMNSVICHGALMDYEHEFNENYKETNQKEIEKVIELDNRAKEEYKNNTPFFQRLLDSVRI